MNHFIKNIEIENFKCFNAFKADGFERINLIGGKNNVGKTAFMEACYINVCSADFRTMTTAMVQIKFSRECLNVKSISHNDSTNYLERCDGLSFKTNVNESRFLISDESGKISYKFRFGDGEDENANKNDFSFRVSNLFNAKFIDIGWSDQQIITNYSAVQLKDEESYVDSLINKFDPQIEGFKVVEDKPMCKTGKGYRIVTEFGDGVRHLLSIVCALFSAENGYVFIDEIDTGIHYTMLDHIWKFVFELAEEYNVQVFATTHSLECISSFNRIQLERADSESSYFEMAKKKSTNEIFMTALSPEQLEYELETGGRFRGE